MDPIYSDAIENRAADLARAIDDPAAIAAKLAEWAKEYLPERIASALWITAKGDRDKGIEITLRELTLGERLKVRVGALLGGWSAGLGASVPLMTTKGGVSVSVGVGAVVPYADLGRVEPVATFTLRF